MYISKLQWSLYSLILQNDMDFVISFDKSSWSALDQLLLFLVLKSSCYNWSAVLWKKRNEP